MNLTRLIRYDNSALGRSYLLWQEMQMVELYVVY